MGTASLERPDILGADVPASQTTGPATSRHAVTFSLPDEDRDFERVRLCQEVARPRVGPDFDRTAHGWALTWPRPPADRAEYQLEVTSRSGDTRVICDPTNPLRAPGPFGDKSVVEWPEYEPPAWSRDDRADRGLIVESLIECQTLRRPLRALLWSSVGTDPSEPLPLLVAHDGPEYAQFSELVGFLDHKSHNGELPPLRAALIAPVERNHMYSASAQYARALAHDILPWLNSRAPTPSGRNMRVGMGASLGALAMLHVHRTYAASFGALYLQSGSFFRQRFDKQESGFVRFRRINRFVGTLLSATEWAHTIPITMTCGTAEENLANNQAVRDALTAQGYDVAFVANRDAHNWVAWRDTFDPHLVGLLAGMWA